MKNIKSLAAALFLCGSLSACVVEPPIGVPVLHDYHFYPTVGVYYDVVTGYYHYRDGGSWVKVRILPPRIILSPKDRVPLRLKPSRPYDKHVEHRDKYRREHSQRRDPHTDKNADKREREENQKRYERYNRRPR